MRIDSEYLEKTLEQFELDYNMKEGVFVTPKIHVSPLRRIDGARFHEKQDSFFKAAICAGKPRNGGASSPIFIV